MSKPGEQTGKPYSERFKDGEVRTVKSRAELEAVPSAAPVVTEPKKGASMNIYDKDFPLQIRDIAGKPCMIIHEPGKIDIIVEVQDGQIPALNALRNLIETIYGKN